MDPELARAFGSLERGLADIKELYAAHAQDDKVQFHRLTTKVDGLKTKWAYAAGGAAVITFAITNSGILSGLASLLPK